MVPLLNVDFATKIIALRLKNTLLSVIHPCQSGYVKDRFIGESIRLIEDTTDFTKVKNISGIVVFLDFQKAKSKADSIEWEFIQNACKSPAMGQCVLQRHLRLRH